MRFISCHSCLSWFQITTASTVNHESRQAAAASKTQQPSQYLRRLHELPNAIRRQLCHAPRDTPTARSRTTCQCDSFRVIRVIRGSKSPQHQPSTTKPTRQQPRQTHNDRRAASADSVVQPPRNSIGAPRDTPTALWPPPPATAIPFVSFVSFVVPNHHSINSEPRKPESSSRLRHTSTIPIPSCAPW
jgi:hypothetical protein